MFTRDNVLRGPKDVIEKATAASYSNEALLLSPIVGCKCWDEIIFMIKVCFDFYVIFLLFSFAAATTT